ncbi:hypothetical protein Y032_0191g1277 [Ancylostoma ceylanicum]|uniref:Chitin-binding type-2 domain-containing protein n=1 Tax=Ancylostoma ceylanicum TaxID=53326 RepID=A0A016SPV6_9BILA|nr:hypothetical protein Y032_0191g1277 [Ancylostoma ceylanicum]
MVMIFINLMIFRLQICEYPGNVQECDAVPGFNSSGCLECFTERRLILSFLRMHKWYYIQVHFSPTTLSTKCLGRQIPMYCPAKLAFDETRQLCDYPLAVAACAEENSGEGSAESSGESSGEESGEEASGEESGEEASGEESGEEASGEESGEEASGEESGEEASGEESGEDASGEESGEEVSGESSGYDESAGKASGESSGEASGEFSGDGSGGLSEEASGNSEASGESSDFPPSELASEGSAYAPIVEESWDSTPEPVEPENTTPVPQQLATFCENKPDGFYASGCSSEMIACVAGVGTSMLCPAHLIFDERKQICEYPENVPCSATKQEDLGECEAEGTTAHGPCSNTFTNCVEGKAYSLACDDGYVFSETHGTCTEASKVAECATATTKPY